MVPKKYTPDYFPHWTEVAVRFNDMNALSHVNNALFNSYFEEARIQLLQEIPEWIDDLKRKRIFYMWRTLITASIKSIWIKVFWLKLRI